MNKQVLFIQGGGEDGYEADKPLVASLRTALGKGYDVHYPELKSDESVSDFGWPQQIGQKIADAPNNIILVAHSLGASLLLKYLTEHAVSKQIAGIFLLAIPFWSGSEDWKTGLKLQQHFADKLPRETPVFFYHCEDDEEIPVEQMNRYRQTVAHGIFRELKKGGHAFKNNLTAIANDIQLL